MHAVQTGVGMLLFALVTSSLFFLYRSPRLTPALSGGITLMRHRYCLLLCLAPAALGIAALARPYMLSALLVVRPGYSDIAVITIISFFTVGVGLAEMQLISLHGDLRFADRKFLLPVQVSAKAAFVTPAVRSGWSAKKIIAWFALSLVLPVCCVIAIHDHYRIFALGTVIGTAIAMLVAMIVAILQRLILGNIDETAASGILPFEFESSSSLQPSQFLSPLSMWLFGTPDRGFSKWLAGPGYTDPGTGVLLPGQAQNIILLAFSTAVFLANYVYVLVWDSGWHDLEWPTAFFAVLLLFCIGYLMCGIAYWLDRYGLPPVVFAVVYVVGCFWFGASDHYFEVDVKPRRLKDNAKFAYDTTNSYALAAAGPKLAEKELEQLYWSDVLEKREFPEVDGERILIVVTASGGGIQAAAWSAKVLTELDHAMPQFAGSIGLISSVSGGSVGAMHYVGHRGDFTKPLRDGAAIDVNSAARMHSLEGVGWGLAFPDFVRCVAPPAAPPLIDRGWALEAWWWNQMGRKNVDDRAAMKELTIRDLIPLINQGTIPPIVFNSTCVETGQRVQISPLHVSVSAETDDPEFGVVKKAKDRDDRNLQLKDSTTQLVSRPLDFLDFYDACLYGYKRDYDDAWTRSNVRVSTAARLSATFSYVTPVARPCPQQDFGPIAWVRRMFSQPTNLEKRLNLHFCDGGYADNPGLISAIRAIDELLEYYEKRDTPPPFDRILIVRIEPFPETQADVAYDNSGYLSAVYGPTAAMHATRVSSQAERGELELRLLQKNTPEFFRKYAVVQDMAKTATSEHRDIAISGFLKTVGAAEQTIAEAKENPIKVLKDRYREESGSRENRNGRRIPVQSVQFRFKLDQKPSGNKDEKSTITPPLTWTLTEAQSKDIDRAWDDLIAQEKPSKNDHSEEQYILTPARMFDLFAGKKRAN